MARKPKDQPETGATEPQEGAKAAPETTSDKQVLHGKTLREWCATFEITDEATILIAELINEDDRTGLRVFPDGNAWMAIGPEHTGAPEDKVAFGQTPEEAIQNYLDDAPNDAQKGVESEIETATDKAVVMGHEAVENTEAEWDQLKARIAQMGERMEAANDEGFKPEKVYIKVEFPDIPGREELIQHLSASDALGDEETPEGETDSLFYWVHLEKGLGTVMQLHLESIGAQPQMITPDKTPNLMQIAGGAAEPLPLDVVLMLAEQTRFYNGEPGRRPQLEKVTNEGDRTIGTFDIEEPSVLTIEYTPNASRADGANIEKDRLTGELRRANAQLKTAEGKRDQTQSLILSQVNVEKYLKLSEEAQTLFAQATATNDPTECLIACTELEKIAAAHEDKTEKHYEEPTEQVIQSRAASLSRAIQGVRPVMDELEQDQINVRETGKQVAQIKGQLRKVTPDTKVTPSVYRFDLAEPRNFWID